eukprot:858018-Rhodomonas_salina.5
MHLKRPCCGYLGYHHLSSLPEAVPAHHMLLAPSLALRLGSAFERTDRVPQPRAVRVVLWPADPDLKEPRRNLFTGQRAVCRAILEGSATLTRNQRSPINLQMRAACKSAGPPCREKMLRWSPSLPSSLASSSSANAAARPFKPVAV